MNLLTFRQPTHTYGSDACEHGIGGYNMKGKAWRLELPQEMIGKLTINLLEYVAAVITIDLTIRDADSPQKLLAYTDSSSALGWLHSTSFSESRPAHEEVSRRLARTTMRNDSALYSQHIQGKQNFIADSLSRDHHLTNEQLTHAFTTLFPRQTPPNFAISPLPSDVTSWVSSLSHLSTKTQESLQHRCKSKLGALTDGSDSWRTMASRMSGWLNLLQTSAPVSSPPLQELLGEISMAREKVLNYEDLRSKPPSRMYVRPSGRIYGLTPP